MNKTKRALIYGMLLGDGCLKTKKHQKQDGQISTYYEFVIAHSPKQEEYLSYKRNLFHSILGGKYPSIHKEVTALGYDSLRFSRANKVFRLFHKYLYCNNNKKQYTRRVLDFLNPHAIAIWYMDDGGIKRSFRVDGTVSSAQMMLSTYCSESEADIILQYFLEIWGIEGRKKLHKSSQLWYIVFNTKEGKILESIITPFIIPSMKYKLPSHVITRAPDILIKEDDDIV
jgi:recombination protein RecA